MSNRITVARDPHARMESVSLLERRFSPLWGEVTPLKPFQAEFRPARAARIELDSIRYFRERFVLSDVALRVELGHRKCEPLGLIGVAEGEFVDSGYFGGRPVGIEFDGTGFVRRDTGQKIEGCRRMLFTPRLIWGDFAPPDPRSAGQEERMSEMDLMV